MKDDRIRYVGTERQTLHDFQVMAAVITNANLPAVEMATRIIRALSDLKQIIDNRDRPFLCALHQNCIEAIPLKRVKHADDPPLQ